MSVETGQKTGYSVHRFRLQKDEFITVSSLAEAIEQARSRLLRDQRALKIWERMQERGERPAPLIYNQATDTFTPVLPKLKEK